MCFEMRPSSMGVDLEFLQSYLEEEFPPATGARVQLVFPTGTMRSIDLNQDYDPDANSLHTRRGVRVLVKSRDYFFPAHWVGDGRMDLVRAQVEEIHAHVR